MYCIIYGTASQAERSFMQAVIFVPIFKEDDTMTIEKLPSGSYRATVMENGKRYRKTFDHKPTHKEVMQALAEEMKEQPKKGELSFMEAAEKYCESKRNVLSP